MTETQRLVERDDQLLCLNGLMAACAAGRGGVAVVGGGFAHGKSELLAALARRAAAAGFQVLTAGGSWTERDLPFGVLAQLFRDVDLPAEDAGAVAAWLDEAMAGTGRGALRSQALHGLCMAIIGMAERRPVLISVDDADHADEESLRWLLALVRRIVAEPVLVVLAGASLRHRLWHAELLREPHCRQVTLPPLSPDGVAELLGEARGGAPDDHLVTAARFWLLTGGNPLLVRALLEDQRAGRRRTRRWPRRARQPEPAAGDAFEQAVLGSLCRGRPIVAAVARGAAVLDDFASVELLARMVGADTVTVEQSVAELAEACLLVGCRFRHPAARDAVYRGIAPTDRADLHLRAAEVLHADGAPALVVAAHLLAAPPPGEPWMVPALCEAADQALRDDRVELAADCLELAERLCEDESQRAAVATTLTAVRWRFDPATAARRLSRLVDALREGHLTGRQAVMVTKYLLWHGRIGEARDAVERWSGPAVDPRTAVEQRITELWMSSSYPGLAATVERTGPPPETGEMAASPTVRPRLLAAGALSEILHSGADAAAMAEAADRAEQVLQASSLDDLAFDSVEFALLTLVYADRPERAAYWCDTLLERAHSRRAPWWQALLASVRAEVAVRLGDLPGAAEHARAALTQVPPQGWGVAVGEPLGSLLLASTAMGRYDEAADQVSQPVTEAMFQTRYGLHYLYARGTYFLETEKPQAALGDFLACGTLMNEWGLDLPSLVPWRTSAAQAYLAVGRHDRAHQLAAEQLSLSADADTTRTRGISLRMLAATSEPRRRPALFREAVEVLQSSGDRLEMARALAGLSQAHRALGEVAQARTTMRRAWQVARQCRAESLCRRLAYPGAPAPAGAGAVPAAVASLSEAERRVAALAAFGHTNREIAARLFITVSTVEQHLTRVFRKLRVRSRADLPSSLLADLDPPPTG
ncbi:MAG: LuxR C-terminal-related transcriptional regulator [Mycobacteriales bacterium]